MALWFLLWWFARRGYRFVSLRREHHWSATIVGDDTSIARYDTPSLFVIPQLRTHLCRVPRCPISNRIRNVCRWSTCCGQEHDASREKFRAINSTTATEKRKLQRDLTSAGSDTMAMPPRWPKPQPTNTAGGILWQDLRPGYERRRLDFYTWILVA